MKKLYSINLYIEATAYIKAETKEAALAQAKELQQTGLELAEQDGEIPISGKRFDDPDLPDISLSPAMTISELGYLVAEDKDSIFETALVEMEC